MRLASRGCRSSWTGLFSLALMGLQTARAVELNVDSDGEEISEEGTQFITNRSNRVYQAGCKGGRNEHDDILHRHEPWGQSR